jgi:hypothetical protein
LVFPYFASDGGLGGSINLGRRKKRYVDDSKTEIENKYSGVIHNITDTQY